MWQLVVGNDAPSSTPRKEKPSKETTAAAPVAEDEPVAASYSDALKRAKDEAEKKVSETPRPPTLIRISKAIYNPVARQLKVNGWCLCLDSSKDILVTELGGAFFSEVRDKSLKRNDVFAQYPLYNDKEAGWSLTIQDVDLEPGAVIRAICVSDQARVASERKIVFAEVEAAVVATGQINLKSCSYSPLRGLLVLKGSGSSPAEHIELQAVSSAGRVLSAPHWDIHRNEGSEDFNWTMQTILPSLVNREEFAVEFGDASARSGFLQAEVAQDSPRRQTALRPSVQSAAISVSPDHIDADTVVRFRRILAGFDRPKERLSQVCYFPEFTDRDQFLNHQRRAGWYLTGAGTPFERVVMAKSKEVAPGTDDWPDFMGRDRFDLDEIDVLENGSPYHQELVNSKVIAIWKPVDAGTLSYLKKLFPGAYIMTVATDDPTAVEYGQYCTVQWRMAPVEERQKLLEDSHERFRAALERQRSAGKTTAAVFGTGPSLDLAWDHDFSNSLTVVCNSIVSNTELVEHLDPTFICAGDAVSHYGVSAYAEKFRADLATVLNSRDAYLFASAPFGYLMTRKHPEIAEKIIICEQTSNGPNFDLETVWALPRMDSTLNIHMLPIAGTFSDTVYMLGLDGKDPNPDNNEDFWSHSKAAQYHDLVDSGHIAHPTFATNRLIATEDRYLSSVHESCLAGEAIGKFFFSLAKSFTPAIHARPAPKHLMKKRNGLSRLLPVSRPEQKGGKRALVIMRVNRRHFSGGRYHGSMLAEALAEFCDEVVVWSNNVPSWHGELGGFPNHGKVTYWVNDYMARPEGDFDYVVIVPDASIKPGMYYLALEAAQDFDAKTIFVNFESPNWFNSMSPVARPYENFVNWYATGSFCDLILSSASVAIPFAEQYYRTPYNDATLDYAPPAINNAIADIVVSEKHPKEKQVVVISRFGSLNSHKNMDQLLNVLPDELAGYTLALIVGTGEQPTEDALASLTDALGEKQIGLKILYMISDREKFEEIAKSELMIFPSLFEGFGYPPVEAAYVGTPCVAYDLPVLREFNDDFVSFVPIGDADAMRDTVRQVIKRRKKKTPSFGATARSIATVDAFSKRLKELLEGLPDTKAAASFSRRKYDFAVKMSNDRDIALSALPEDLNRLEIDQLVKRQMEIGEIVQHLLMRRTAMPSLAPDTES